MQLKAVISRSSYRKFMPRKDELLEGRIKHYKVMIDSSKPKEEIKAAEEGYKAQIQRAFQEYGPLLKRQTILALEFLDIPESSYVA